MQSEITEVSKVPKVKNNSQCFINTPINSILFYYLISEFQSKCFYKHLTKITIKHKNKIVRQYLILFIFILIKCFKSSSFLI